MNTDCLKYCMTDEQREQFDQEGYLIVPDALDDEMLGRVLEAGDRVDREERQRKGSDPGALMAKFRTIVEGDVFLDLLDWPKTFPLIWDILGWNVQHYISHLIYYPPESVLRFDKVVLSRDGVTSGEDASRDMVLEGSFASLKSSK